MNSIVDNEFGYCYYAIDQDELGIYAVIYNLYIYPKFRRKGKAREVLQTVIHRIKQAGYKDDILIEAVPQENSISVENLVLFYKSLGLKVITEHK